MKKWLVVPLLALASLGTACASHYGGYAAYGPPPPRVEAYGHAPGPGHVWIQGFYSWRGGRYIWVPGYWTRPPRPGRYWVAGSWEHHQRGYRWRDGHWR